jgi:hypothetical protein
MVSLHRQGMNLWFPQKLCNLLSNPGTIFIQQIPNSVQLFSTADGAKIVMRNGTKCCEGTRGLSAGAVAVFVRTYRQKTTRKHLPNIK